MTSNPKLSATSQIRLSQSIDRVQFQHLDSSPQRWRREAHQGREGRRGEGNEDAKSSISNEQWLFVDTRHIVSIQEIFHYYYSISIII